MGSKNSWQQPRQRNSRFQTHEDSQVDHTAIRLQLK